MLGEVVGGQSHQPMSNVLDIALESVPATATSERADPPTDQ